MKTQFASLKITRGFFSPRKTKALSENQETENALHHLSSSNWYKLFECSYLVLAPRKRYARPLHDASNSFLIATTSGMKQTAQSSWTRAVQKNSTAWIYWFFSSHMAYSLSNRTSGAQTKKAKINTDKCLLSIALTQTNLHSWQTSTCLLNKYLYS